MLLIIKDVYVLINYVSFVEALFTTLSVTGLLWLRYKKPDLHRPIKVSILRVRGEASARFATTSSSVSLSRANAYLPFIATESRKCPRFILFPGIYGFADHLLRYLCLLGDFSVLCLTVGGGRRHNHNPVWHSGLLDLHLLAIKACVAC